MKTHLHWRKWLVPAVLIAIFLTRLPALMHNAHLHPDEPVFYHAAQNLLGMGQTQSTKYYPEGSFVLHAPFQLIAILFSVNERLMGRIAGLLYFILGAYVGLMVLRRYFSKTSASITVYLLTMAFGLMHIEQSRYATGDTASFLFLMLLIFFSAMGMETGKMKHFLLAAAMGGCLAAIKYPQAFFLLIPFLGFCRTFAGREMKIKIKNTLLAAVCFLAGFLVLSPKTLTDPTYIFWTCVYEIDGYFSGTNITELGGPHNHLISMVLYTALYAGMPLLTVAAMLKAGKKIIPSWSAQGVEHLLGFVIPIVTLGFFLYNLFVTALFMRTYYPFFCIVDLYCAAYCGSWVSKGKVKRAAVICLCVFTLLRGSYYLYVLSTDDGTASMQKFMEQIDPEDYTFITELGPGQLAFPAEDLPMQANTADLKDARFDTEGYALKEGELLISASQEYLICTPYYLPISNANVRDYIARWAEFKEVNQPYRLGMLYPKHYYYLFGFWVRGATGANFEFPANIFYLNPVK